MKKFDAVIVGGGPAGIATAIQLDRYKINSILFEKNELGGLLRNANLVENYLGFPLGINGEELVNLFKKQLQKTSINIINEEVTKVDYSNESLIVKTKNNQISNSIVIIATGTKPKLLSIDNPNNKINNQILYEIYPIKNIKNKTITIIGSGDAAFDYALSLSKNNIVYILNRSKKTKCLTILKQKCIENKNITYHDNTIPLKIKKENNQMEIFLQNNENNDKNKILSDFIIGAIGRKPSLDFISNNVIKYKDYLINEKKLYIIGDAVNGIYRQASISIGDGIRTAMQIYRNLNR